MNLEDVYVGILLGYCAVGVLEFIRWYRTENIKATCNQTCCVVKEGNY